MLTCFANTFLFSDKTPERMPKISEFTSALEQIAPPAYQESYDNAGLIVGDPSAEITGVLLSLDATEDIVNEAVKRNCNLILAHHPIVFRGLKKITGRNYVERTIIGAIKTDTAIYAAHTNLDNVRAGVNAKICEKIGLENCRILVPKTDSHRKLSVFVPAENAKHLQAALAKAGAGRLGNYSDCAFLSEGTGTFRPDDGANPHLGRPGETEEVREVKIEMLFPTYLQGKIIRAMRQNHPYEEVAHFITDSFHDNPDAGSGMIGELAQPLDYREFLAELKTKMELPLIRHTAPAGRPIRNVAVCGGAGGFLLNAAAGTGADVFVTADYKYHEFFDADGRLMIADIGHYESEKYTGELFCELLRPHFPALKIELAKSRTNPVYYFK